MQPDPMRLADTQAWLTKAAQDLGAGERDVGGEPPYSGDAMFHAQQAGVK